MRIAGIITLFVLLVFERNGNVFADLTKSDIDEIRKIMKEEIQHVDKRIDDLRSEVQVVRTEMNDMRGEIKGVRIEINGVRGEIKDEIKGVRTEINDMRGEIKGVRTEMIGVRDEIKDEIKGVRAEMGGVRGEIKDVRYELQGFLLWGFGVVFAGIFALIGFVLWDRRTAIAPAIRKNQELEERESKIEQALKEYAKNEPRLKEILRHIGLL